MKRKVFHVVPLAGIWLVRRPRARRAESGFVRKTCAITRAQALAKRCTTPSQVIVHRKNGRIQTEWTYGKDPRRTRG